MAERVNINRTEFDEPREHPGFTCRRARLSRQAGADRLGLSLWEIPPGEAAYPYHAHLTEEEMVVVLSGSGRLRTPEGWSDLAEGDVLSFLRGPDGAHQIVNTGEETMRFLAFSTNGEPDVVLRPDSGHIGVYERLPDGGGLRLHFHPGDDAGYWVGVERPDPS